jgi:hypothetical protein
VKEISSEYEKEVERIREGEIVKRKVDKISFVSVLLIEFMLIKEEEEKKKFVKNHFLPVLPFLLCGEEKEREEEEGKGEDVDNATVFHFIWCYFLYDDSLPSLLLSDERNFLLNKTLLFSLRRDSPFTRIECMNVLWSLFQYGKEEEVKFVIREGGMKCIVLKIREKEEREEKVKRNGKEDLTYYLCQNPFEDRIPTRMKEGWKGKELMRKMIWMMEEEDVKETLIMSSPHEIFNYSVFSFNYSLGMCLRVR